MKAGQLRREIESLLRDKELELRKAEELLSNTREAVLSQEHTILKSLQQIVDLSPDLPEWHAHDIEKELERRNEEKASLKNQRESVEVKIAALLQDQERLNEELDRAYQQAHEVLSLNVRYQETRNRLKNNQASFKALDETQREINQESENKLVAYQNPCFQYLKNRRFGTPVYQQKGVFAYFDRRLAECSFFEENQTNENILIAMNLETEKKLRSIKISMKIDEEAMNSSEEEVLKQSGHSKLKLDLAENSNLIQHEKMRVNDIHERLAEFDRQKDSRYLQIKGRVTNNLTRKAPGELWSMCRATASSDDDELVNAIIDHRKKLHDLELSIPDLENRCREKKQDFEKAKKLQREMQTKQCFAEGYQYPERFNFNDLCLGYLMGQLSMNHVINSTTRARQEEEQSYSSSNSSFGSGSFGSSSSFGGGSYDSSSGFGGGGFSTTDKF